MRLAVLLVILLICVSCSERITADTQIMSTKSGPPASGWVAYHKPTEDELRCANYSRREWRVALNGEQLEVTLRQPSKEQQHVINVNDGSLTGADYGEFGGGLWWSSTDQRSKIKLSNENIIGFVNSSKGVLAIAGLTHMDTDYGKVL